MAQDLHSSMLPWCSGTCPKPCGDKGKEAQQFGVGETSSSAEGGSFLSTGYGPSTAPLHSPFPHFQLTSALALQAKQELRPLTKAQRTPEPGQRHSWLLAPLSPQPLQCFVLQALENSRTRALPPALQCLWPCSQHGSGPWLLSCKGFSRHLDRVMDGCINTCFV